MYGTVPTSGPRDILVKRLFAGVCPRNAMQQEMRRKNQAGSEPRCYALREDGAHGDAGENDARIVHEPIEDPEVLGILGYNFPDRNRDRLRGAMIVSGLCHHGFM